MENKKIEIQVLGSGCPTCEKLFEITREVVKEMGLDVEIDYITDVRKIIELGLSSSPVLVVNNEPVFVGFTSDKDKIKSFISSNL